MKRNILLFLTACIVSALLTYFICDLLNNTNADVLVNINTQDNLINNAYVRDDSSVNNTTTNSNTTTSINSNKVSSPASWIIAVALLGTAVTVGVSYGILYYCLIGRYPSIDTPVEMEVLN